MQIPEKLSLIGGSILLASTLIFTLKSQASSILPKVERPISSIYDHAGDAAHGSSFPSDFKDAQRNGEQTGTWGTAKYYIDNQENMHIGPGKLNVPIYNILGNDEAHELRTITLDGKVQAPDDSIRLFANVSHVAHINGAERLNTSQVTSMSNMFSNDYQLDNIDLSNWDTSQVTDMTAMFSANTSLSHLSLSNWNTSQVTDMSWMFYKDNLAQLNLQDWDTSQVTNTREMFGESKALTQVDVRNWNTTKLKNANSMFAHDYSLPDVDLSGWQTSQVQDLGYMFDSDSQLRSLNLHDFDTTNASMNSFLIYTGSKLNQFELGNKTYMKDHLNMADGSWHNNGQVLSSQQLLDGNSHPGTWLKQ